MNKTNFLELFGSDHLFSAYDYKKEMPPVGNITDIKELRSLNRQGYCIFFAVNSMKNYKRNNNNVKHIRAIWVDDDNPRINPRKRFPLPPSIVVQTSAHQIDGHTKYKYQYYWLTKTTEFSEFELVMQTMIDKHGNDKGVRDKARVLRVPGYYHMKDRDHPFRVKVVGGSQKEYPWEAIKIAFPPAEFIVSSTKEKGKYSKNKARSAIADSDDFHGSLRDRAMELANKRLDVQEIMALLTVDMMQVPEKNRDKRWQDRISEEHLFECANSAVIKYESEGHEDGDHYEYADIRDHSDNIISPKINRNIISPPDTALGELVEALHGTWWVPNIMVAGLAARSIVAYLAGGKYSSLNGDRVNIQQVAIGETGCGKDLLFNRFGQVIDQVFQDKEEHKIVSRGIIEEVGSPEGIDLKLRTCGKKHDVIWMQDEIGGLLQAAKRDNRKREIMEMLLKFYTKSNETVSERALIKSLPEGAAKILFAPHIILSGATTPRLITQGLDSTFLSFGSASRMIFFPVSQYVEPHIRQLKKLKLSNNLINKLHDVYEQKDTKIYKYPHARIHNPQIVKFSKSSMDLCFEQTKKNTRYKNMEAEVWNRHVANSKKYAQIEAILENPERPFVGIEIMKRSLDFISSSCEYSCNLFTNEIGETESDIAKRAVLAMMKNLSKDNRVIKMSDINNNRKMRRLKPNERYSLMKEMENDGSIVEVVKENVRGKPTKTFRLSDL